MTKLIKKLLRAKILLFLGFLYTLLITIAFLTPPKDLPELNFIIPVDKLGHIAIHFILSTIWLYYYFIKNKNQIAFKALAIILALCFTYGIIIEIFQFLFIASRNADILDILANSVGLILGAMLFWNLKNKIIT